MKNQDTLSKRHEQPLHFTNRGRLLLGGVGLAAAVALGSHLGVEANSKTITLEAPLSEEQKFDNQIHEAIENGPKNDSDIIGVYPILQDRTVTNAIIQEAVNAGRSVDLNDKDDLRSITLSGNAYRGKYGASHQPEDIFVLFEQDVNGDGKKELLASSVDAAK
ncbi:MAG: hypothetical protein ABWX90_01870 [Candidatus Saccharimonadales bacterium]